jgi:hypothetical protein
LTPASAYTYTSSALTTSDTACTILYELSFWTDTNLDTIKDPSEYSVIPTTGAASPFYFYKGDNTVKTYYINILMPLTNIDVGVYHLKSRAWIDTTDSELGNAGAETTGDIEMSIMTNCFLHTIVSAGPISDISYTVHATAVENVFSAYTSSDPVKCPPYYIMQY